MKVRLLAVSAVIMVLSACSGSNSVTVDTDQPATDSGSTDGESTDNSSIEDTNPDSSADSDSGDTADSDAADSDGGVVDPPPTESMASYRVTFNATWSAGSHPLDFPDDPHFSGLVGAVHNEQVQFWMNGQLATDGIALMAETGDKTILLEEVDTAIANGYANAAISGAGISTSPDTVSVDIQVSADYPQVTLVSMVAPSPDWFVGVHNLSLLADGAFVSRATVDLAVYDAGTDSGVRYTSADVDTQSPEPIGLLTSQPDDAPFQNGQPFVGQFVFERL